MKLIILCILLGASISNVGAQTNNFDWPPNPASELVTNYVLRCVRPIDNTIVASNFGVATNAAILLSPGTWECVLLAQNYVGISDPSNVLVVQQAEVDPILLPGIVSGLSITARWHAGAFDITATWLSATNAANYTVNLINLVTGTTLTRNGANRSASWLRVPASIYRLTAAGVNVNGLYGPLTTLELGTLKPGKPRDLKLVN